MSNPIRTGWVPFKIPATPTITNNDVYSLACTNGADSEKNPSQFLEWKKTLPNGQSVGDILCWSGSSWFPLSAPSGGLHVLASAGGIPYWIATEDC